MGARVPGLEVVVWLPSPWLIPWKPVFSELSVMEVQEDGNNLPCPAPRDSLGIQGLEGLCGVTLFHGTHLMAGIRGISSSYCWYGTGGFPLPSLNLAGHSSGTCGLASPGSFHLQRLKQPPGAVRHPRVSSLLLWLSLGVDLPAHLLQPRP